MTPGLTLLGRGAEYIDVAAKRNWGQRPLNSILANPAAVRPILARVRAFASMGDKCGAASSNRAGAILPYRGSGGAQSDTHVAVR